MFDIRPSKTPHFTIRRGEDGGPLHGKARIKRCSRIYSQSEGGYDVVGVETGEGFKNEEAEEWLDGMEGAKVRREEREAVEEAQETGKGHRHGGKKGNKGGRHR